MLSGFEKIEGMLIPQQNSYYSERRSKFQAYYLICEQYVAKKGGCYLGVPEQILFKDIRYGASCLSDQLLLAQKS